MSEHEKEQAAGQGISDYLYLAIRLGRRIA